MLTTTPLGSHVADGVIGSVSTSKSKTKTSKTTSPIITLPDSPKGDSKSLVFTELMCDFSSTDTVAKYLIADESLFLISTLDPWYGDIIIYLQTQNFWLELSWSQLQTPSSETQYAALPIK